MKLEYTIGIGECVSCGAIAPDVAVYKDEDKEKQCCKMCAYEQPWLYGNYGDNIRTILETILYVGNVIRMDRKQ